MLIIKILAVAFFQFIENRLICGTYFVGFKFYGSFEDITAVKSG